MGVLLWILVVAVIVVAIAAGATIGMKVLRRERLRRTFGLEYDRTLELRGKRRDAEADLLGRLKRRRGFEIQPLERGLRDQYAEAWTNAQTRFVDEPAEAVRAADALVIEVMGRRGYPMGEFDERAGDISVDHPDIVERYRSAHGVAQALDSGQASTEDLRVAMVHYRALVERLLVHDPVVTAAKR